MAAASTLLAQPKAHTNDAVSSFRSHFKSSSFTSQSTSFGSSKFASKSLSLRTAATRSGRPEPATLSHSESQSDQTFDVLVIGAGIIGLTIARQFLIGSDLSVAIIDKSVPCSGATGAGQGYIWMGHKTPGSDLWDLGLRSQKLWEELAESLIEQGLDPLQLLGWKKTGSLLVGRTPEDLDVLKRRVKQVCEAGLRAEYLSSSDLHVKEPELLVDKVTGAAFLPDDCQLDARCGVEYLEQGNRNYASKGRYAEFYNHPVISLLRSGGKGEVVAIKTSKNTLHCKKAIVVAAGCWSGSLMRDLLKESEIVLDVPVKPRKGHLLVLENFNSFHLNHGLMEVGYVDHQTANPLPSISTSELLNQDEQTLSVSMTATMDAMGNIILGSSRQFAGFCTELEESIISRIWERAGEFFPKLKQKPLSDISKSREVRVGLRPYMPDGKPVIGPVPGLANVFLATGHEGGGLSLALGTAEMLTDMVLGNSEKDYPYAADGLEIWTAIQVWVTDFCMLFYTDDISVRSDEEIQAWWSEIRNVGHGDKSSETWWYQMASREDLIKALTTLIWIASALHASVNFGQYAYAGYPLNRPTLCRRFIPEEGTLEYAEFLTDPDKYYLSMLPKRDEMILGIALAEVLSQHTSDEVYLGQRPSTMWIHNEQVSEKFEKFKRKLRMLEERIESKNTDPRLTNRRGRAKIPYMLLYPDTPNVESRGGITGKGIPNSISI